MSLIITSCFSRKQLLELESEKRYLEKSNKHLENILEATKAHTKQEVSQLNKIHAETIKVRDLQGFKVSLLMLCWSVKEIVFCRF